MRLLVIAVLLFACGKKDTSPRGLCERGCKKMLGCMPNGESQLDSCVDACLPGAPDQARVERIEAASCDELGGMFSGGNVSPTAPVAPVAPAATGCTADCRGCASDGNSCYAVAGGANGIPCDPCCCAPGGPAPTWKTE